MVKEIVNKKVKGIDYNIRKSLKWVDKNFATKILPHLDDCSEGSIHDIYNVSSSYYYRYLAAAMRALKPKQVVELGSAGGASALMMLSTLPKESKLYACSIKEPEGEFRFIKPKKYPNLKLVRGNDLTMGTWYDAGIGLNSLKKTDIWFFDTDHTYEQVHAELTIYDKYFKKRAIVFLDDTRMNEGMIRAWDEIKYPKLSLPNLHHSGFGFFYVDR